MLCCVSANLAVSNSFDPPALASRPGAGRASRPYQQGSVRGSSGSGPRFIEQFHSSVDSNAQLAQQAREQAAKEQAANDSSRTSDEADRGATRVKHTAQAGSMRGGENRTPSSNSARAYPLWNPMWHAIAVPATINAADPGGDGPALGDLGSDAPGVETQQSDSLSANANFLTGMLSSLKPATGTAGEKGVSRSGSSMTSGEENPHPSLLQALRVVSTRPATEVGTDIEGGRANLEAEQPGTEETGGEANGSGAALATGSMAGAPATVGSGLAALLTNVGSNPPSTFTPLVTVGRENRGTPDSAVAGAVVRVVDGAAADRQSAREGFLLDARDWLALEQPSQSEPPLQSIDTSTAVGGSSTDPGPVAISSPIAQSAVFDQLLRSPGPTSPGRLLPADGHGAMPSLMAVNVEKILSGVSEDPLSFVVRVVEERPHLGGSSPQLPNPRAPPAFAGTSEAPSLDALGRARDGSFERDGKEAGIPLRESGVAQGRSMSAPESLGASGGGQGEGGDGQHHPFAREESASPNAIPRAGGERDFASTVAGYGAGHGAGHGAGYAADVVGLAGSPRSNESGSEAGVNMARLQETAEATPGPAPERLTAAPRELVLTIPGSADGDGVLASVHVRDRNGAVEIAVRTPDAQLSSSLQDGLPELVARLETQGTTASASRGEGADGGPPDGSSTPDGQRQERQPPEGQRGQGQHAEDRGEPRGQPQLRERRQERQARWQASLGLASG